MNAYNKLMNEMKMSDVKKKKIENLYKEMDEKDKKHMRKAWKPVAAIAACMVLVLTISLIGTRNGDLANRSNIFSLTANAADLKKGDYVAALTDKSTQGWAFCGTEDGKGVSYFIDIPYLCEGENIKTVTYKINKGAFGVSAPEGKSVVIDGKEYDGELNTPSAARHESDEMKIYTEYTVNYDKQTSDDMLFGVCGISEVSDVDRFFNLEGNYKLEEQNAIYQEALKGIKITCIVTFEDGKTQSQDIELSSKIMTAKEANMQTDKKDAEVKSVYPVYMVK